MTITYHRELMQGTAEWLELRRGKLTASTMKRLLTPKKQQKASNEARYAFMCELLAQRVTGRVEASYMNDDMMRGTIDEEYALAIYAEQMAPIQRCGFIENDKFGFPFGYSPDALVGDDGLIEVKSHNPGLQVEQILSRVTPSKHMMQLQAGLLISERKWIDFVSYSGGLPMQVIRVRPDQNLQEMIAVTACEFERDMRDMWDEYEFVTHGMIVTERQTYGELV